MTVSDVMPEPTLFQRFQAEIQEQPKRRARELAAALNVSEGQLVACRQGNQVWQLQFPFTELLTELVKIGEIMTITRNEEAVHEHHGIYRKLSIYGEGKMGLVLSDDLDLRLFLSQWRSGFHVIENGRESLQFFDQYGIAVHKVYKTDASDENEWQRITQQFRDDAPKNIEFEPSLQKVNSVHSTPENFDAQQFDRDWADLKDVHEYHGMLKKHQLSRTQALRNIGPNWAQKLNPNAVVDALEQAQQQQCPIMIFVGNPGCIQIFSGTIEKLMPYGPWFNILDPEFNLHLRPDLITETWIIRRPSKDGIITSIEAFNQYGDSVITLFGKRKPGEVELPTWQELAESVEKEEPSHVM